MTDETDPAGASIGAGSETPQDIPADSPEPELRYRLPEYAESGRRARWFTIAVTVFFVAEVVWELAHERIPPIPVICLVITAVMQWRIHTRGRDAVATREGMSGPHLRHPIRWSDVAFIQEPLRYDSTITVELEDGQHKVTGFPPADFDRLKALAPDVPVKPKVPIW